MPDKAPVLEASWREAVEQARKLAAKLPLFIGGKSMGGRIASHIASQGCPGLSGIFFLGYPLHPPGAPEKRRDAHLPLIQEPMLFVQGSRDAFGTSDEIDALLPSLKRATLHVVPDGDHSFKVRARRRPQARSGAGLHHGHGDGVDGHAAEMMGTGIGIRDPEESRLFDEIPGFPDPGPRTTDPVGMRDPPFDS